MAQKMTGALVFDERTDRYDIRFDLNSYYGGLNAKSECFEIPSNIFFASSLIFSTLVNILSLENARIK
mgnify:CR=1 FL=1